MTYSQILICHTLLLAIDINIVTDGFELSNVKYTIQIMSLSYMKTLSNSNHFLKMKLTVKANATNIAGAL